MRAKEFINEDRQQLNEFFPAIPVIAALATGIRIAAPYVARGLWGTTKVAARNPIKTGVGAVAATHPEETGKAIDIARQAYNVISNPEAAAEVAAKSVWNSTKEAANDIADIVGKNLTPEKIELLADAAIKYALPVAAVIAILYGGKVLYDYMSSSEPQHA
jgi:hypothetical protein